MIGSVLATQPLPTPRQMARWINEPSCLTSRHELTNVLSFANAMLELYKSEAQYRTRQRNDLLANRELRDLPHAELMKFYHGSDHLLSKKDRRGLEELRKRAYHSLNSDNPPEKLLRAHELAEIIAALFNRSQPPFPAQIDLGDFFEAYQRYVNNPIGIGRKPGTNQEESNPSSTLWRRPASIADQNLYYGFNRTCLPNLSKSICLYAGPKLGYGRNPGFEIVAGGQKYKVKFADVHSEPFVARIFTALGYNADPTDHVPHLQVKYDRRIITEFNVRKEMPIRVTAFGAVPLCKFQVQRQLDPFDYIVTAVLKDGSRITSRELRRQLFYKSRQSHPEHWPQNFRTEFERQLDFLITSPACIKCKEPDVRSIGPWDYTQLGHQTSGELRRLGLLAAWLGWFDSRSENTRLKIVQTGRGTELRHYFTDVGSALGHSAGLFGRHSQDPNAFPWSFTRPTRWYERREGSSSFRIFGVQPLEETPPFRNMTLEDARAMARLISQLTEEQLRQALAASGFDAAQVRLFTEKLVSRRDQMIRDLGLTDEIALLRPRGTNRRFHFDPAVNELMTVQKDNAQKIVVGSNGSWIENGRLVHRPKPKNPPQERIASR